LDFCKAASLDFPATSTELVAWVGEQSGEFNLSSWFFQAVDAKNPSLGLACLEQAKAVVSAGITARRNKVQPDSTRELEVFGWEVNDLAPELEAINCLLNQVPVDVKQPRKRQRRDVAAENIEAAIAELGCERPSAHDVRKLLKRYAAQPSSGLSVKGDAVGYMRAGRFSELSIKAIGQRLKRS
jgi:hypothetical protein